ncbi:MAG: substrate-binding domain-containing protein, partial [Akkermansiaceae bacterium]
AGAGPDKLPSISHLTERLIALGHQRIVLLARRSRRLPEPGAAERCFIDCLEADGITTSDYNLPDWDETAEGFHACLQSLFEFTPPTAIIADEAMFFFAVQQFCLGKRIRVPEDVSLVSTDDDPIFSWLTPGVSHIRWDRTLMIRSIKRWVANISRGREDHKQVFSKAEFVEQGTTGPAKG